MLDGASVGNNVAGHHTIDLGTGVVLVSSVCDGEIICFSWSGGGRSGGGGGGGLSGSRGLGGSWGVLVVPRVLVGEGGHGRSVALGVSVVLAEDEVLAVHVGVVTETKYLEINMIKDKQRNEKKFNILGVVSREVRPLTSLPFHMSFESFFIYFKGDNIP